MLRKFFKGFLLLALVFLAIWLVVIAYWRMTGTDPNGADLALYLVALPIAVIAVFFGAKALVKRVRNKGAEDDTASANSGDTQKPTEASRPEDALYLCLLDSALRLPVGSSGEDALAVLAEGKTRPGLDDVLVDDQGFPVFATRVEDVVDEGLEQALDLPGEHKDTPLHWAPAQMRALAMGRDVLDDLLTGQLPQILAELQAPADSTEENHSRDRAIPAPPPLQLRLLLPAHWSVAHRESASAWFREHVERQELHPQLTVIAKHAIQRAGAAGFGDLNDLAFAADNEDRDTLCVILACDSLIGETEIARLDGEGRLFSQSNPGGMVPGEGAAGLVAASPGLIAGMAHADYARVHRAAVGDRQTRTGEKSRRSEDQALLGKLGAKALANARRAPEDIGFVISDGGINSTQARERAQLISGQLDHLDPTAECPNIGTACGDLGIVGTLAAIGLSHSAVRTTGGPVLAVSLWHPLQRAAAVLQPPAEPESASDDPEPAATPA
ncbi:hypothetical protein [Salinisphaera sp.]|uniref:hypothetical protein n=1 Tax=Salinisphaera sp. TaxID=1914330 RepID=UPI000C45785B|nr:hypothetical protein [Salinisphaera sp.]MBS63978.1 hypothetical protein [Salinisphaera sp.]